MRHGIAVTLLVGAAFSSGSTFESSAQQAGVVTFDAGNFGWHWTGLEWIEATAGNPGAYFHGLTDPVGYWAIAFNSSTFVGDYASVGLASLGIDLAVFDISSSAPLTLMLLNDNNTPGGEDDWGAYLVSSFGIPKPADGWLSYDFEVQAQEQTVPSGWNMWHTTVHTWAELMQDVTDVRFVLGDPDANVIEQGWDVGMDNVRFTEGEPGHVPPDMVMQRVTASSVSLTWSAPRGCGLPQDYAIYEGLIGDWTSHVPVVCTDEQHDLHQRIPAAPGNRYYLVVPLGTVAEGSYGVDSAGQERPPALVGPCRPIQSIACG